MYSTLPIQNFSPWKSVQKLDMVKVSFSPNWPMLTAVLTILFQAIYGDKTELLKRESMGVSNFLTSIFANVSNILNHFHNRSLLRT